MTGSRRRTTVHPDSEGGEHGKTAGSRKRTTMYSEPSREEMVAPSLPSMHGVHMDAIPIPGSVERKKSEILSITDKITRALTDFDKMYDESEEESALENVNQQINGLESGELKFQLKGFVNQYKVMSSQVDSISNERDEILKSLSDWFSSVNTNDPLLKLSMDDEEMSDRDKEIRDAMLTSKQGFDKLNQINQEIIDQASRGRDVHHLEAEKLSLQSQVIKKFKDYKNVRQQSIEEEKQLLTNIEDNKPMWKHAAGEICSILHKIRDENTDEILEMEKKLKDMVKSLDAQTEEIYRLKAEIRQMSHMENKWKKDCMVVTNEKAVIARKLNKMKRELRHTNKRLAKYEAVKNSEADDIDDGAGYEKTDMGSHEDVTAGVSGSGAGSGGPMSDDPTILRTQLRNCRNQVNQITEESQNLQERIAEFQNIMEEKEDDILRLEQDKKELLYQMKQASVRPNTRRLSISKSSDKLKGGYLGASVNGIHVKAQTRDDKHTCKECGCHLRNIPARSHINVGPQKRHTSNRDMASAVNVVIKKKKHTEQEERTQQYESLKLNVMKLEKDLAEANDLTNELRAQNNNLMNNQMQSDVVPQNTWPQNNQMQSNVVPENIWPQSSQMQMQSNIAPQNIWPQIQEGSACEEDSSPQSNSNAVERDIRAADNIINQRSDKSNVETIYIKVYEDSKGGQINKDFISKSMQTDPYMDPLGAWSQGIEKEGTWRPLMPPAGWVNFDPTSSSVEMKTQSIGTKMLRGVEPLEIRNDAINCANFVERELDRMRQGIVSFIEYTNGLVDRETRLMSNANNELKTHLSSKDLESLEQALKRPYSANLKGNQSSYAFLDLDTNMGLSHHGLGRQKSSHGMEGGTGIILTPPPTKISPVEERIKYHVNMVGRDAINTLKKTYDLVFSALQSQHQQYEHIYTTVQNKPDGSSFIFQTDYEEENEYEINVPLNKHKAAGSFLTIETSKYQTDSNMLVVGSKTSLLPTRSKTSKINLSSASSKLTQLNDKLDLELSKSKSEEKVNMAKKKTNIVTATTPKKGLIYIATDNEAALGVEEKLSNNLDKTHRKVRPMPMNHKKLLERNKQLLDGKSSKGPLPGQARHRKPKQETVNYEITDEYFSGYTIGDIEKKIEENLHNEDTFREHRQDVLLNLNTLDLGNIAKKPVKGWHSTGFRTSTQRNPSHALPPLGL